MLPAETERVWNFLKSQPALAGFILVGGSALALRIAHRRSEDLDLTFRGNKLPRERLDGLRHSAQEMHLGFERDDNEAALQEFLLGGMELHETELAAEAWRQRGTSRN